MGHELSNEEVADKLLQHLAGMRQYWAQQQMSDEDKLDGLLFSLLTVFDGEAGDMPAFQILPMPHPVDKVWHQGHGENWYPVTTQQEQDIAGSLHERYMAKYSNRAKSDEP